MGMFDDLFSSSRGPGVIGTLFALLILVGFGTLYMFVFDEGLQGGSRSIESVIRDQANSIDMLQSQIAHFETTVARGKASKQIAEDVETHQHQLANQGARIEELVTQKSQCEALMKSTTASWEQYKGQYRKAERGRAVGEKIPELVTKAGKVYKAVTIKSFDDSRVSIMSETGFNGIGWKDLPDSLIDRFQYTEELARVKIADEAADSKEMDKNTELFHLMEDLDSARATLAEEQASFRAVAADVNQCRNRINDYEREIHRLNQLIAAEANKAGLRQTPRYRAQTETLTNKIQLENNKIAAFAGKSNAHQQTVQMQEAKIQTLSESIKKWQQQK